MNEWTDLTNWCLLYLRRWKRKEWTQKNERKRMNETRLSLSMIKMSKSDRMSREKLWLIKEIVTSLNEAIILRFINHMIVKRAKFSLHNDHLQNWVVSWRSLAKNQKINHVLIQNKNKMKIKQREYERKQSKEDVIKKNQKKSFKNER